MDYKAEAVKRFNDGLTGMDKVVTLPNGDTLYVAAEYAQGQVRAPQTRITFHYNSKKIGEAKLDAKLAGGV